LAWELCAEVRPCRSPAAGGYLLADCAFGEGAVTEAAGISDIAAVIGACVDAALERNERCREDAMMLPAENALARNSPVRSNEPPNWRSTLWHRFSDNSLQINELEARGPLDAESRTLARTNLQVSIVLIVGLGTDHWRTDMSIRISVLLLSLLAAPLAGAGENCRVFSMGDGQYERVCTPDSDHDGSWEFDCNTGRCILCGVCHQSPAASKPEYSQFTHPARYAYVLKAGERLRWADGAAILSKVGDRLCLTSAVGKTLHCFPTESVIVKDPKGAPVGVITPTRAISPITVPKPSVRP